MIGCVSGSLHLEHLYFLDLLRSVYATYGCHRHKLPGTLAMERKQATKI